MILNINNLKNKLKQNLTYKNPFKKFINFIKIQNHNKEN